MANSGRKNDNGSQFFLTLGDTKELTGRNTMFGKIVGDTIYNLVRMGQGECEEGTERPVYPVKILGAEIIINPFEDMKPREVIKKTNTLEDAAKKKAAAAATKKKKGKKALLSFGGDEGEDDAPAPVSKKPKFNTRLVVAHPRPEDTEKPTLPKENPVPKPPTDTETTSVIPDTLPDAPEPTTNAPEPTTNPPRSPSSSPEPPTRQSTLLSQTNAQIAALKQSLRRGRSPPPTSTSTSKPKKSLLQLQKEMLPPTSIKGRKRKRGKQRETSDDEDAVETLKRFQSKLTSARPETPPPPTTSTTTTTPPGASGEKGVMEEEKKKETVEDEDLESILCDLHFIPNCASCGLYDRNSRSPSPDASEKLWTHTLSFEKDRLGKDLSWRKRNEELAVIDPREKEKDILGGKKERGKGQAAFRKERRGGTEWGRRREEGAGESGGGGRGGAGGNGRR